ncbi:hypothetical protein GS429_02380 [Natronorubrum sp. JWXQ-INN-674]|uniref:Uncharacterized protein n=1 Tax=Natronorubrum halalkaliphilum TaxID=2691917 RepID=A0A6B0VHG8_9EURY|nr:hypothetical protein [Natronorubrum halalkaliphilum]MXV60934.1 hypothetical protein [Natronorubrum halalkaliphilum]
MRRSLVVAAALLALSALFVGGPSLLFSPATEDVAPDETEVTPRMTALEDSESEFWRFLSPAERFQQRSPLNVIVRGDTDDILRAMTEEADGEWEEMEAVEAEYEDNETVFQEQDFLEEHDRHATGIEWGDAHGTTRYAYVDPGTGEDAYWTTESAQLEDGDYYGQRYHIRLYESPHPDDQWVVMQGHTEHFDWFTLRHRVDGVEAAQTKIESDFMEHPRVDVEQDVRRVYLGNEGPSDANGWATVVDLTGMVVLPAGVGLAARKRSRSAGSAVSEQRDSERVSEHAPEAIDDHLTDVDRRRIAAAYDRIEAGHIILFFTILALFLGVRMGGLLFERRVGFMTPHMIAAALYPVIAVGIPVATYAIAGTLTRRLDAAIVAAGSLAVAIWLDYGLLGVDSLPVDVVFQRMLVVVALGLIAGGAAKRATRDSRFNDMLIAGITMWVVVLGGTLLGYF